MKYLGIDCAGQSHKVAVFYEGKARARRRTVSVPNGVDGFETKLLPLLKDEGGTGETTVAILESTGHYWIGIAVFLRRHKVEVILLNPVQAKAFAQTHLRHTKNDDVDARLLAEMGPFLKRSPHARRQVDELLQNAALVEGARFISSLCKNLGRLKVRLRRAVELACPGLAEVFDDLSRPLARAVLEKFPTARQQAEASEADFSTVSIGKPGKRRLSLSVKVASKLYRVTRRQYVNAHLQEVLEEEVLCLVRQIAETEAHIARLQKKLREWTKTTGQASTLELLETVPGIGRKTSASLVGEIGDIDRFHSVDALLKYAGVYPQESSSGKKGERAKKEGHHWRMSKKGNSRLRQTLFLASLYAVGRNPVMKAYYAKKLGEGKKKMTALGHVMAKLLRLIWGIWRSGRPYDLAYAGSPGGSGT